LAGRRQRTEVRTCRWRTARHDAEERSHGITQANVAGVLRSHLIGSRGYVVVELGVIPRVTRSTRIAAELIRRGADGIWPANPQR
jgi:hypothetical protein